MMIYTSIVMVRCLATGRELSTGVEMDAVMFDSEKSAQDASCRGFFVDPPSRGNILSWGISYLSNRQRTSVHFPGQQSAFLTGE